MQVKLIAVTSLFSVISDYQVHPWGEEVHDADELAEMAGRLCYESWDRPNPATATNAGYLANIIDHGHFSVLEHASATFYISGVSRTLTHELVRHRHLSFSQVSQRYVNESQRDAVVPPALQFLVEDGLTEQWLSDEILDCFSKLDDHAKEVYDLVYATLSEQGLPKKEARQAARAALLASQETSLVVTGNHRSYREVIAKRNSPHADKEIQQLAKLLLAELKKIAPNTYFDLEV